MANVLVTGGTGFIGSRVCTALHEQGDTVHVLSRNPSRAQSKLKSARAVYGWNPETEKLPSEAISDMVSVVHLAGETIAGRWNAEKNSGYGIAEFFLRGIWLNLSRQQTQNPMCLSAPPQLDTTATAVTNVLQRFRQLAPIFSLKSAKNGSRKPKKRLRLGFGSSWFASGLCLG